jgi:hypothetical protein
MNDHHRRAANLVRSCIYGTVVYLAVYVFLYLWAPLPGLWGDLVLNLFVIVAGGLATLVSILIWRRYQVTEAPYSVWKYLALGLCSWVVADTVWAVYNVTVIIVPTFSLADLFYLLGYSFILTALHRQFRLFYRPASRRDFLLTGAFVAAILLADLIITPLMVSSLDFYHLGLGDFISVLYPVVDVAIAVTSILFISIFRRGAFARPWIGLTVLAIADSLFAWLVLTDRYSFSVLGKNIPSMISDGLYVAAYLILAILLLHYYLLVRYGPSVVGYFLRTSRDPNRLDPGDQGKV